MIIDYTYFKGMLGIGLSPDTGAPSITLNVERECIEQYIDIYEMEYLKMLLGSKYDEFVSSMDSEEWLPIKEFLQKDYSPIACYVWFKYVSVLNVQITRMGSVTSADNSLTSPIQLQVRVWNDMVKMNHQLALMLGEKGIDVHCSLLETINDMGI